MSRDVTNLYKEIDELAFRIRQCDIDPSHEWADLTDDALAALDALVAKTLAWEQTAVTGWGHRDAIQAECDCLRKALERIEHAANNDKPHGQIAYIARAALAGECR